MANANSPFGLLPVNKNGSAWTGQTRLVYIPSTQATAIFVGDPLVPLGGADAFGVPAVGLATAGAANKVLGAFLANSNGPAGAVNAAGGTLLQSSAIYHAASVAGYALITDDPAQYFAIQEDSDGAAIAQAAAGYSNGNLISGTGNTGTGLSGWMLDSSSVGSGNATYQLKVIELLRGPDNVLGNYAKWLVKLNTPALGELTVGY